MYALTKHPENLIDLALWAAMWGLGGIWLLKSAFKVEKKTESFFGVLLGFILQVFTANFLAKALPVSWAFWLSAGMVFLAGLIAALKTGGWKTLLPHVHVGLWLLLGMVFIVSFAILQGYAIQDEYAHLPMISAMAAGTKPAVFPFDPAVRFGYHYFMDLAAAEIVNIAHIYAWTAFDLLRAFIFALGMIVIGLWAEDFTKSPVAGALTSIFAITASGMRWIFLILPREVLSRVSAEITLMGSAAATGDEFIDAVLGMWHIDGDGPLPFPFAFHSDLMGNEALNMFGLNSLLVAGMTALVFYTASRWHKRWLAVGLLVLVFGASGLIHEIGPLLVFGTALLMGGIHFLTHRKERLPDALRGWLVVIVGGMILSFLSGGVLTQMLGGVIDQLLGRAVVAGQYSTGFRLAFPPKLISGHLGGLSLFNPAQLLVAFGEVGLVILVLPLVILEGWRAYRKQEWLTAFWFLAAFFSMATIFIEGTDPTSFRNASRLYYFIRVLPLFFVPLFWNWLKEAKHAWARVPVLLSAMLICFGGVVFYGVQIFAIQERVQTTFVFPLDAQMAEAHWDQLPEEAMVFDIDISRSITLFGRVTRAASSFYDIYPEYDALMKQPEPSAIAAAGFDYAYFDTEKFESMPADMQAQYLDGCAVLLDEARAKRINDYRLLYDLSGCE